MLSPNKPAISNLSVPRFRTAEFSPPQIAVLFAALILLISIPIWTHPLPPLSDYVNHLARMHVIATLAKNPQLGTEFKLLLKDSPNFIGVAKGEDKLRLKVNEIIAAAKASGELNKLCLKWLGRPIGDLPG